MLRLLKKEQPLVQTLVLTVLVVEKVMVKVALELRTQEVNTASAEPTTSALYSAFSPEGEVVHSDIPSLLGASSSLLE